MDTKKTELERLLSSVNNLSDHISEASTDLTSLKNSLSLTKTDLSNLKTEAVTQTQLSKVTPSISETGYWKIGGVDTGVLARGVNGIDGVDGKDGKDGEKGDKGDKGDQGVSISIIKNYYKKSSRSSGETIGDGWSESIPTLDPLNKYLWNYEVVYNSNNIIFSQSNPCVIGSLGSDGVGIESIIDYYGLSATSDVEPTEWSTTVKTITAELKCLWNYEVITYSNGTSYTTNKSVIGTYGRDGADGKDGVNGKDGVSISRVEEWYLASSSKTNVNVNTDGWSTTIPTLTETNRYLWNYEKIYDSNENIINTITPTLIGSLGESGANGRGIKSITIIEYYKVLSVSSAITLPSGLTCDTDGNDDSDDEINSDKANIAKAGWSTSMQVTTDENKYLWNFEMAIYTFDDGNKNVTYTDPAIIGTKGDVGNGVESIESKYAVSSTTSVPEDSEFTTTYKTPDADHKYLWEKTRTTYTNGTYAIAYNDGWTDAHIIGVFGKDGSDADVNFANCCSALGITSDTSNSGIYSTKNSSGKDVLAINADVILTDDLFATRIKSVDIEAENLKVSSANITGDITAKSIEVKNSNGATVLKANASYPDQTSIGGFSVDEKSLKSGLKSFDDTDTAKGVYVGTDGIKVGQNFYVDSDGNVTAKTLRTITGVETAYASSTSGSAIPTSGWNADITKITLSTYTWTRTITTYSTNETDTKYSVAKNGNDGSDGNTWLPSLDSDGNLSWKIDKSLITPTTINIKGPQGMAGVGIKDVSLVDGKISITNTNNETLIDSVNIKGSDGATPTIVDNEWVINNKSTGVRALGEDGKTPEITQNGNVLSIKLDGVEKFNANLKGEDGLTPEIAQNGNILSVKVGGVEKFNADLKGENGSDGKTYIPSWNGNKIQFSLDGVVQDTLTSADLKGKDGVGISDISIANGLITIAKTDGSTPIKGVNIKGDDGVGIKDISITDGKLTITKTDNTTPINAINVKGDVGDTWYPSINSDGDLSWAKNSTSTTPSTINIKGEKGDTGATGEKGDKGDTGAKGTDGTSIASVVDYYLKSSNNTNITIDGNTWSTSIPTLDSTNKYLWNYEKILDTNGNTINTTSPTLIGSLGEDGVSITSVTDYYQSNNSESVPTIPTYSNGYSGWSTTPTQVTSTSKFLWNFERIDFSDGKSTTTTPSIIGNFAIGVKSLEMYYGVNNDSNNAPTTMNTTKATPTSSNRYLWMKTKTTYDDDSISWTDAQIISVYGEKGDSGRGIKSIATYYALSSTTTTPSDSDFDETSKTPTSDNKYLWEKTITYYDNGTDSGWTTPHIVGVFGKDGSDADVTFANCCNALGITTDTTSSGIYQDNGKLAINADVILTDTLLADKIEALDVTANNLKVKMANVDGELTANKIKITTDGNNTIPDPYSTSGSYECQYNSDLANYTMVNGKVFGVQIISTIPYFRDAGMTTYSEKPYGAYPATIIGGISGVTITSNGESYSTSYFARGIDYTHKTFDSKGNQLTSGSYSLTLPDKSGTIATLDDVAAATGTDLSSYLTIANAKTTYAPISHTHAISDITNLQTTLNNKASATHNHQFFELSNCDFNYEVENTTVKSYGDGTMESYLSNTKGDDLIYCSIQNQLYIRNQRTGKYNNVSGKYTISCTVDEIINCGGIIDYLTNQHGLDITEVTDVYIKTSTYPPYRLTYDLNETDYVIYYGDTTLKIDRIMETPLGSYFQGLIYRI